MGWKPNWIERQALKLAWSRVEKRMPWIKRWIPFLGSVVTTVAIVLGAFPKTKPVADTILGVVTLVPGIETVDQALVLTATTSVTGLAMQSWARFKKARGQA